jgi:hypothetical protein
VAVAALVAMEAELVAAIGREVVVVLHELNEGHHVFPFWTKETHRTAEEITMSLL